MDHEVRGSGSRVVLLHGFSQNSRCWGDFAEDIASDHEVVLVDLPGHGNSSGCVAGLTEAVPMLAELGPADWIGYSLGGRFALHLALARPSAVERLFLIGASPGLDSDEQRRERLEQDTSLACRLIVDGLEDFLHHWIRQPLFADLDPDAARLEERMTNTVEGLASSLLFAGTGVQDPLWDRLGELEMPVRYVAGGDDPKYRDIGRRTVDGIGPNAGLTVVDDAGHAAHLQRPRRVAKLYRTW